MDFLSIPDLRERGGLRIVLVAGVPSPWGQAAKAMMEHKGLDYVAGLQMPGEANEALVEWARINSGPVVASNDEAPINNWLDILNLLERLAPARPLLPADPALRAEAVGLSNEICGELGLGWNRRLSMFRPAFESGQPPEGVKDMGRKYRYNEADVAVAAQRQVAGLAMLDAKLAEQRAQGRAYFVGDTLTAVDFYWAGFSTLFDLPEAERIPVDPGYRPMFELIEPEVKAAITPALVEHRDHVLAAHFRLPMEF